MSINAKIPPAPSTHNKTSRARGNCYGPTGAEASEAHKDQLPQSGTGRHRYGEKADYPSRDGGEADLRRSS